LRLRLTVPSELGAALRALAEARGTTVSHVVTEAIDHHVRVAALDRLLADADRRFGPVPEELIAREEAKLLERMKKRKRTKKRRAA
jgi:predicted transcriptional regulator